MGDIAAALQAELMRRQLPKVVDGRLERPYPINSRADLNRARVLPTPMPTAEDPTADHPGRRAGQDIAIEVLKRMAVPSEQPQGGLDYIMKRNQLLNSQGR